ncbi:hypothetical protein DSECCO2_596420 [anaerobic digester metagenome]
MDILSLNLSVRVVSVQSIRQQKMETFTPLRFSVKITYSKNTSKAVRTIVFKEKLT